MDTRQRRTPQEAARRPYVEKIEKRIEKNPFNDMFFIHLVRPNAQQRFAADAAGAAP